MRLKLIFADDKSFYGIKPTGELLWTSFNRDNSNPEMSFPSANDPKKSVPTSEIAHEPPLWGSQIGIDWQQFIHVFAGGHGIIYAVKPTGELIWYRDMLRDGSNDPGGQRGWHVNSGKQIGINWQQFIHVFDGGDGIIYAVKPTGQLIWYRDMLRDGSNDPSGERGWNINSGKQIGTDWQQFVRVISGGDGIIYAATAAGELFWYRDLLRDGTNGGDGSRGWTNSKIGTGWNTFTHLFSALPGEIFGCFTQEETGQLAWYVDKARNGTADWQVSWAVAPWGDNAPINVSPAIGWEAIPIEGYCWPLSATAGELISFFVSAILELPYTVTYLRLQQQPDGTYGAPLNDPGPFQRAGRYQSSTDTAWQDGCGWYSDFHLQVPSDWASGFYAACCTSATGYSFYIPFVVRPAPQTRGNFILIANVNTWNAYNRWSGQGNYTFQDLKTLSFLRPNWSLLNSWNDHPFGNHLIRGEIWVLDWLHSEGYQVDLYTDIDFEAGIVNPQQYTGVILSTHPEYWSENMMATMGGLLDQGLDLIYLGGNGMYRTVTYNESSVPSGFGLQFERFSFTTQRTDTAEVSPDRLPLIGVRSFSGDAPRPPVGFTLSASAFDSSGKAHPFLHGLKNLTQGAQLGTVQGLNGLPCGWEIDALNLNGNPVSPNATHLADCTGSAAEFGIGGGLQTGMITFERSNGSFVFSACSISFGGALAVDDQLKIVVRNVLNASLKKVLRIAGFPDPLANR